MDASLKLARTLLALLALAALALPAAATGHYAPTYSQGTWRSTGQFGTLTGTFDAGTDSEDSGGPPGGGGGGGGGLNSVGDPDGGGVGVDHPRGPGDVEVKGPITLTLTWVPDHPGDVDYPPVLVVKETSYAAWTGDSGACASGLPNETVETPRRAGAGAPRATPSARTPARASACRRSTSTPTPPSPPTRRRTS